MPRKYERKYQTIRPWFYKYYPEFPPGFADRIRLHNYRCWFLNVVADKTPEVVDDLARDVLPWYREAFWNECEEGRGSATVWWDNRQRYHDRMAESWLKDKHNVWRGEYSNVRAPLLEWARKYRICEQWVLKMALDALLHWARHHTTFDRFCAPSDAEVARMIRRMKPVDKKAYRKEVAELKRRAAVPISWPESPLLPNPPARNAAEYAIRGPSGPEPRVFEYRAWDGFDEERYEAYVREEFEKHFDEYKGQIARRAARMNKVESFSRPERFEMLALYLCKGWSPEKIASEHVGSAGKSVEAVYRDVSAAARLLSLTLKRPGRPRGSTQKHRMISP